MWKKKKKLLLVLCKMMIVICKKQQQQKTAAIYCYYGCSFKSVEHLIDSDVCVVLYEDSKEAVNITQRVS